MLMLEQEEKRRDEAVTDTTPSVIYKLRGCPKSSTGRKGEVWQSFLRLPFSAWSDAQGLDNWT